MEQCLGNIHQLRWDVHKYGCVPPNGHVCSCGLAKVVLKADYGDIVQFNMVPTEKGEMASTAGWMN